jgi:hypothetical protein
LQIRGCEKLGLAPSENRENIGKLAVAKVPVPIFVAGKRWLTDESVRTIGDYFGGVSTPAISKAVQRAEIRCSQDRAWERQLKRLMEWIRSSGQYDPKQLQIPERKSKSFEHTPGHAPISCRDWCPLVAPGFPGYPSSCGP